MNRRVESGGTQGSWFDIRSAARLGIAAAMALALIGCKTISREEMAEKFPFKAKYSPRWETNEVPFEEANAVDKFGRNIRDGFVGVINNFFQGFFGAYTTINTGGSYFAQKGATAFGDIFGLLDDNEITEHVFKGVLSRQFLRYGSGAQDYPDTIAAIHDTTFETEKHSTLDYVGNKAFHTDVYGRPSSIATFVCIVAADFAVRPAGNFMVMFQMRKAGESVDKAGLKVIQAGLDTPFW